MGLGYSSDFVVICNERYLFKTLPDQETTATATTAPPLDCCLQEAPPRTCRIKVLQ